MVGFSLGGWIAAEMAIRIGHSHHISAPLSFVCHALNLQCIPIAGKVKDSTGQCIEAGGGRMDSGFASCDRPEARANLASSFEGARDLRNHVHSIGSEAGPRNWNEST